VLLYLAIQLAPFGLVLLGGGQAGQALGAVGFGVLWPVITGGLMIGSLVARLRGIRL
jgi:hypothetical protein